MCIKKTQNKTENKNTNWIKIKIMQIVYKNKEGWKPTKDIFSLLLGLLILATIASWQLWPVKFVLLHEKQITWKKGFDSLSEIINNHLSIWLYVNYCYSPY